MTEQGEMHRGYQPIENYGVIGDMHTVALVGLNGSIDWCCIPRFDSPSLFAALLDANKGGYWQIRLDAEDVTAKQFYWPDTNVLVTRFLSEKGVGEVTDYMPIDSREESRRHRRIIRTVNAVRGPVRFVMECFPAFDYARQKHQVELNDQGACFTSPGLTVGLSSEIRLERKDNGVVAHFSLTEGCSTTFILRELEGEADCGHALSEKQAQRTFHDTVAFWRRWLSHCTYSGRWRETVNRSALVLKLLTYEPTGAIIAAPTCSLPEHFGGTRNWDYRYTWMRDAAFTIYALLRIGFKEEAAAFMHFLSGLSEGDSDDWPLQVLYGIDGRVTLAEETLDHLEGYRGSAPVRIGNAAYQQLQLDIYGELIDSIYIYNKHASPIPYQLWKSISRIVDWVCDNWQLADESVWEVRAGRNQFVYSKLMCWVAIDRCIRISHQRGFPADHQRWLKARDEIFQAILTRGWNEDRHAFVQAFDSFALDASVLMMPLVFFMAPNDPMMLSTFDAILKTPDNGGLVSNSLVYRYNTSESADGLIGQEGTFNMCTFWLVEALTRAGRTNRERLEQARLAFEQMLGYANHVGLYAEETGRRGEHLGNFPQAFTHLALISAATNLDHALGQGEG